MATNIMIANETAKPIRLSPPSEMGNVSPPSTSKAIDLFALSSVWLVLCAGLVYKHPHMMLTFLSFLTCFGLSALWMAVVRIVNSRNKSWLSTPEATKNCVGLIICVLAWISVHSLEAEEMASLESYKSALSYLSGYLAYHFWYAAFFCQQFHGYKEDALTLTGMLILLVGAPSNFPVIDFVQHADAHFFIAIRTWLAYKSFRISLNAYRGFKRYKRNQGKTCLQKEKPNRMTPLSEKHQQMKRHESQLWKIHGHLYDFSSFVERHPGGVEAILLGQGRDASALFESYHPFADQQHLRRVLAKYLVANETEGAKVGNRRKRVECASPVEPPKQDAFYSILCQRVRNQLQTLKLDPIHDRGCSYQRMGYYCMLIVFVAFSGHYHLKGSIWASALFGVAGWLLGALGHDAGHYSVSSHHPVVNDWCLWGMSWLCNPYMWQHQHTYAHHGFTNDPHHDPDLHHFTTFLRVHKSFAPTELYRHQSNRWYVFWAYTFVSFGTCLWVPWSMMKEHTLYGLVAWTDRHRNRWAFTLHFALYLGIIFVWPLVVQPNKFLAVVSIVCHTSTSGLLFAFFSQINHLNEASLDDESLEAMKSKLDPALRSSWAVQQILTSNNFCPHSTFWHILSNGLNLQIEHHLFPGLNHCHLSKIAPIIQSTCEEFHVEYKVYRSWSSILRATLEWLDKLSV